MKNYENKLFSYGMYAFLMAFVVASAIVLTGYIDDVDLYWEEGSFLQIGIGVGLGVAILYSVMVAPSLVKKGWYPIFFERSTYAVYFVVIVITSLMFVLRELPLDEVKNTFFNQLLIVFVIQFVNSFLGFANFVLIFRLSRY